MRTQTRRGNRFVCCRPGAQAPRLQVSAHAMPMSMNQKASRVRPSSLQARPRGCVLVNLSMKTDTRLDENRFVRCSSGSSSPVHDGLLSTAPHLYLHHQPRHQPRVILQVCLAWCLFLAAAARTRLAPPLLRPTPPSRLVSRKIEGFGGGGSRLLPLPAMHAHSRLAVPAFAWIRLPWSRSNLVIGHGAGVCA